jgi:hypothetical protein
MTQGSCQVCSNPTITRCSICHSAYYCSKECQTKAWPDHKKFHQVRDSYKISYPGDWDAAGVFKALEEHAYLIIKLEREEDIQIVTEFREASTHILTHPDKAKAVAALRFPRGFSRLNETVGHYVDASGYHFIDFRTDKTMTQLYPNPTPSFFKTDYKAKFFKAYQLMADITEKLMKAITDESHDVVLLSFARADAAPRSLARILEYPRSGIEVKPHVDAGNLTISLPGDTVGLGIYDPSKESYVYPESAVKNINQELVVIAGMELIR